MRMRRKSNLDERLELAAPVFIEKKDFGLNMKEAAKNRCLVNYREIFGNDNPVHLEIGCGKGGFAIELAKRNPNINIIAVEKISNVIIEGCERAMEENIKNLRFIDIAAETLPCYIPEHTIERIYINFSNPLPNKGKTKQRLSNSRFLEMYKNFLKKGGEVHQKTDDRDFFEYSMQEMLSFGMKLKNVCFDLAAAGMKENIVTEHEQMFMDRGLKIYRLEAYFPDEE